jgi:rhodanese-related sulfurtransferase
VALQLKKAGVTRIRPLGGGFDAWRKLNLPLEEVVLDAGAETLLSHDS